ILCGRLTRRCVRRFQLRVISRCPDDVDQCLRLNGACVVCHRRVVQQQIHRRAHHTRCSFECCLHTALTCRAVHSRYRDRGGACHEWTLHTPHPYINPHTTNGPLLVTD